MIFAATGAVALVMAPLMRSHGLLNAASALMRERLAGKLN